MIFFRLAKRIIMGHSRRRFLDNRWHFWIESENEFDA